VTPLDEPTTFGDALPELTVAQVAILLARTTRTVRSYITRETDPLPARRGNRRKGPMVPLAELVPWIVRQRLGEVTHTADGEVLDLSLERARLARAQRELTEQTHATRSGALIPRAEVIEGMGRLVVAFRMRCEAVPNILGGQFGADVAAVARTAIREALTELASGVGYADAPATQTNGDPPP
jgi:phage terminase Nu1 subunit (DNA packaging protein)